MELTRGAQALRQTMVMAHLQEVPVKHRAEPLPRRLLQPTEARMRMVRPMDIHSLSLRLAASSCILLEVKALDVLPGLTGVLLQTEARLRARARQRADARRDLGLLCRHQVEGEAQYQHLEKAICEQPQMLRAHRPTDQSGDLRMLFHCCFSLKPFCPKS